MVGKITGGGDGIGGSRRSRYVKYRFDAAMGAVTTRSSQSTVGGRRHRLRVTRRGWVVFSAVPLLAWGRRSGTTGEARGVPDGVEDGEVYGPATAPSSVIISFDRPVQTVTVT